MAPQETLSGYLIDRFSHSETFEVWAFFSKETGLVRLMHRLSASKRSGTKQADLWDQMEVDVQRPRKSQSEGPRFVSDFRVHARNEALGKNLKALTMASRLARLLGNNLAEEEERSDLNPLIAGAWNAWSTGADPNAVFTKFVIRWIEIEGYGNPTDWTGATPQVRELWQKLRRTPVASPELGTPDWVHSHAALQNFLQQETAFDLRE